MKRTILMMMILLMAIICLGFTDNSQANDQYLAIAAEEEMAADEYADEADQTAVMDQDEEPVEAYSPPANEDMDAEMEENMPEENSDIQMQDE